MAHVMLNNAVKMSIQEWGSFNYQMRSKMFI